MKLLFVCLLSLFTLLVTAEDKKMEVFEINLGINPGFLSNGMQKDFFSGILTPTPSYFASFGGYATVQYYPINSWGLFIGKTLYSLSVSGQNTNTLKALQSDSINFGISYRKDLTRNGIDFGDKPTESGMRLYINVGPNYSFFKYQDDFIDLIPNGYTLETINPSFGFYVDCGIGLYINKLRLCIVIEDSYLRGKTSANTVFDGNYITIPIFIGYGFGKRR
jgi:hypothetical protein